MKLILSLFASFAALCIFTPQTDLLYCKNKSPRNVILIVIDALRYDHLNCYGYTKNTSPNIERLAKDSSLFLNAFSQAPWTKPSTASLFTSLYPSQHGVYQGGIKKGEGKEKFLGDVLDESLVTIAEALHKRGLNTAAFITNSHLSPEMGFSQGFEHYDNNAGHAPSLTSSAINWMKDNGKGSKGFFLYLHYIDPHAPYCPDVFDKFLEPTKSQIEFLDYRSVKRKWAKIKHLINTSEIKLTDEDVKLITKLYDGEIYFTDLYLGIFLEWLKDNNLYNDSLIVLTADHGELLYEYDLIGHPHNLLYEELLHIPLIIKSPENKGNRKTIKSLVQSIDIMPTILDLLGSETDQILMGSSLMPLVERSIFNFFQRRRKLIISESTDRSICIRSERYKYIENESQKKNKMPYKFLFDLKNSSEGENILDTKPKMAKKLQEILLAWKEAVKTYQINAKKVNIKKEDLEKLRSLGYIK